MSRVYLHSPTIRIWHWINALTIILLIVTGAQLRSPDAVPLFRYSHAVLIHKYAGFVMAACFAFWLIFIVASGSFMRHYRFRAKDVRGMAFQGLYYAFGMFIGMPNPYHATPEAKFNPMQKLAYTSVMVVLTPIIVITGILFSDVFFFNASINAIGGLRVLDAIHVATAYLFVVYLIVHMYMSTLGATMFSHVKAMITGCEEEKEVAHAATDAPSGAPGST